MKPHSATSRELWFLDTRVVIRVSCDDGADGVSVLEHQAAYGDSPPLDWSITMRTRFFM